MPEDEYSWLPRASLLSFEEIARLVAGVRALGVDKFRLTGGEPLLRRDLDQLVAMIKPVAGVREVALTTNGLLLAATAAAAQGRRPRPDHGESRHAAPGAHGRVRPERAPRRRCRRY